MEMTYQGIQNQAHTTSARPITDSERKAVEASLKPLRNNARGMAFMSIIMAVMVQFTYEEYLVLVPLFFCFAGLGLAVQARNSVVRVGKALSAGMVTEIRASPQKMSLGRGWSFGPVSFNRSSELSRMMNEGVPTSITILPDHKFLLAVNGAPLRKPIPIIVPAGVNLAAMPAFSTRTVELPKPLFPPDEELPPPPDDWTGEMFCAKCGQKNRADAKFCEKCGMRIAM